MIRWSFPVTCAIEGGRIDPNRTSHPALDPPVLGSAGLAEVERRAQRHQGIFEEMAQSIHFPLDQSFRTLGLEVVDRYSKWVAGFLKIEGPRDGVNNQSFGGGTTQDIVRALQVQSPVLSNLSPLEGSPVQADVSGDSSPTNESVFTASGKTELCPSPISEIHVFEQCNHL